MGISGKPEELIAADYHRQNPIPIIRRFSGGGTVVVDENTLFVSLICNADAVAVPPFPKQLLHWNGELYRKGLSAHPFQIQENDYAIGEKKFGGNAQYITKTRWLHHTTLLWQFDTAKMAYLKMPPKMPAYRNQRSHADFLCCLSDYCSDLNAFIEHLNASLAESFSIDHLPLEAVLDTLHRPHRKATELYPFQLKDTHWD